jgi:hypothetical protein
MKYGIEKGQVYKAADGGIGELIVVDCEAYADTEEVVVYDTLRGIVRTIDAFKLAKVRYSLVNKKEKS